MKLQNRKGEPVFQCIVVRHTNTDNTQTGRESLTPKEIIDSIDERRRNGCYLTVLKRQDFTQVTPILLNTKNAARMWAEQAYKIIEMR